MSAHKVDMLRLAISEMAARYGESERLGAYAYADYLAARTIGQPADVVARAKVTADQLTRAASRRFASLQRLVRVLATTVTEK